MKYLIPVDFTKTAANTLNYALSMGSSQDEYVIFHAWDSLVALSDGVVVSAGVNRETVVKRNMDVMLGELLKTNPKFKAYNISQKTGLGQPVFAIHQEVSSGAYDAIVMGTRDKHDLFDKMFGTISLGVIKKTNLPVYLIPHGAEYKRIEKVLVGTDYHFEMEELIHEILEWNKSKRAALHFLHMTQPGKAFEDLKAKLFTELIEKRSLPYSLNFEVIVSDEVAHTLLEKAKTYKHDLIMIAPEKQSWVNSLLRNSVSKDLLMKTNMPLLFMNTVKRARSGKLIETDEKVMPL